jgi:uncharacterized circularly permuted ATP-grasp superfamily protein
MSPSAPWGRAPAAQQAIQDYHEILRGPLGAPSLEKLDRALREEDLAFGDRPICQVARPYFLGAGEARRLGALVERLMSAFRKLLRILAEDPSLRAELALSPAEEAVIAADRQPFQPDVVGRIDGFLDPTGGFQVIEYNAESPGGIAFGDAMAAIFRGLPVMEELARKHRFRSLDNLGNTLCALLLAHRARLARDPLRPPSIAVVDRSSAPTRREFELCARRFAAEGHPARVVDPGDLRFEDGVLRTADGFSIDVVYKRVLVKELIAAGGLDHPLVRAVQAGAVTCASAFGVHILYRKELFALLHDRRVSPRFDDAERAAIAGAVPWSHLVRDCEVERDGFRGPLREYVLRHRTRLVLKPTAEYGGTGVVLGWLVDDSRWERAFEEALRAPSLVQERVGLGRESFPLAGRMPLEFREFYADLNPYVWNGVRSVGCGCRLAPGELLNVTAGGGSAVPVFIVEDA